MLASYSLKPVIGVSAAGRRFQQLQSPTTDITHHPSPLSTGIIGIVAVCNDVGLLCGASEKIPFVAVQRNYGSSYWEYTYVHRSTTQSGDVNRTGSNTNKRRREKLSLASNTEKLRFLVQVLRTVCGSVIQ